MAHYCPKNFLIPFFLVIFRNRITEMKLVKCQEKEKAIFSLKNFVKCLQYNKFAPQLKIQV